MKEAEMQAIGGLLNDIIERGEQAVPTVKEQVIEMTKRFPLYE